MGLLGEEAGLEGESEREEGLVGDARASEAVVFGAEVESLDVRGVPPDCDCDCDASAAGLSSFS